MRIQETDIIIEPGDRLGLLVDDGAPITELTTVQMGDRELRFPVPDDAPEGVLYGSFDTVGRLLWCSAVLRYAGQGDTVTVILHNDLD